MSESKQSGRCQKEVDDCYGSPCELVIADAIDRLAADVAAVKAKVDAVSPEDVRHFVESEKAWVRLVEEQRDAAVRKRDEARAEVEKLKAMFEQQPPAAPQPAGHGISPGLLETQPTQNAAPAAGWLTERERTILELIAMERRTEDLHWFNDVVPAIRSILFRAGSPPPQTAPWWLTDEERAEIKHLLLIQRHNTGWTTERHAELDALLARAGSPPVVEVPELGFLGPMTGREQGIVLAYRDALDKAGVPWKEVGRE